MTTPFCSMVVLAAGEGRRMGGAKAAVELRGRALLLRVLDAAAGSRVQDPVVVLGAEADRVRPLALRAGARWVLNPDWRDGQTSSLQAGILALDPGAKAFLIQPVDHALVTAADMDALVAAWERSTDPDHAILRPVAGGRLGHPVLFGIGHRDAFLALRPGEPGNVVYRRNRERVLLVPVENPLVAEDLDTPEDLARHGG